MKARAIALLARREHSRLELARKLSAYSESQEEINALLDELILRGFLSDERFTESRINVRKNRYGSRRIVNELLEKGVDEDLVTKAVASLKQADKETAKLVWERKFGGVLPKDAKEKAKQIRFLQSRGFDFDVINNVLNDNGDE